MVSPEKRARVANYFKNFSVFEHTGVSYMEKSAEILDDAGETSMKVLSEVQGQSSMKPQDVKDVIRKAVEEKLSDAKDQVLVDVTDGGVRIQLVDKDGKPSINIFAGRHLVRILEVTHETPSSKVWEVMFDDPSMGWATFRSERVASLYR